MPPPLPPPPVADPAATALLAAFDDLPPSSRKSFLAALSSRVTVSDVQAYSSGFSKTTWSALLACYKSPDDILGGVPLELAALILKHLPDPKQVTVLRRVSRRWNAILTSDDVCGSLVRSWYPNAVAKKMEYPSWTWTMLLENALSAQHRLLMQEPSYVEELDRKIKQPLYHSKGLLAYTSDVSTVVVMDVRLNKTIFRAYTEQREATECLLLLDGYVLALTCSGCVYYWDLDTKECTKVRLPNTSVSAIVGDKDVAIIELQRFADGVFHNHYVVCRPREKSTYQLPLAQGQVLLPGIGFNWKHHIFAVNSKDKTFTLYDGRRATMDDNTDIRKYHERVQVHSLVDGSLLKAVEGSFGSNVLSLEPDLMHLCPLGYQMPFDENVLIIDSISEPTEICNLYYNSQSSVFFIRRFYICTHLPGRPLFEDTHSVEGRHELWRAELYRIARPAYIKQLGNSAWFTTASFIEWDDMVFFEGRWAVKTALHSSEDGEECYQLSFKGKPVGRSNDIDCSVGSIFVGSQREYNLQVTCSGLSHNRVWRYYLQFFEGNQEVAKRLQSGDRNDVV